MNVVTLNEKDILITTNQLIGKINFEPDVIIGILNGAYYLVEACKNDKRFSDVEFYNIKLQREKESFKQKAIFKIMMRLLPYDILNKLRVYESRKAEKSITNIRKEELMERALCLNIPKNNTRKKILIVDDAIDTGKTVFMVKNNLKEVFPNGTIKVATIAWTIENSIVQPDFYIFKNTLVRFPWSKDFKKAVH